jgi:ornithine lipid ester-linked acyl 2-hydroxylase
MRWTGRLKEELYRAARIGDLSGAPSGYVDPMRFPELFPLLAAWELIRDEMARLPVEQFLDYTDKSLTPDGWKLFPLYAWGLRMAANCALCPRTEALVKRVPNMKAAAFSRLDKGASFAPHRGNPTGILRAHLGLRVPPGGRCAFTVGAERKTWGEGELFVFDDTWLHSARNDGEHDRVILIVDFLARPDGGSWYERALFEAERRRYQLIAALGEAKLG